MLIMHAVSWTSGSLWAYTLRRTWYLIPPVTYVITKSPCLRVCWAMSVYCLPRPGREALRAPSSLRQADPDCNHAGCAELGAAVLQPGVPTRPPRAT